MADYIFDIDGTLADATHRLPLIRDSAFFVAKRPQLIPGPDWETFMSQDMVNKDTAISHTWTLLEMLHVKGHRIIFITGRNESTRTDTLQWLLDTGMIHAPKWYLDSDLRVYMRSEKDHRPSDKVKREGLIRARDDGYRPVAVFEDRQCDAEMWRDEGLFCFHVAEGDF